jgi:hypothetical protein
MANVSRLLDGAPAGDDFITALEIDERDDADLRAARLKIRERLRARIGAWTKKSLKVAITPRFFTQGSFAYKTLNNPAWPKQQMDMDDGGYLPMTFVKGEKPSVAAAAFFEVVDSTLEELIREEKWLGLVRKPTCSRVILSARSHIDVPLYAIPDEEFERLSKSLMAKDHALTRVDEDVDFMASRRRPDTWSVLPSDKVLLAHREEDWKTSDPRKLHDWFLGAVDLYGEILRRQCRYLKAWRDHHEIGHVSSIILMVYAWQVFEEIRTANVPRRDDLMLLNIAERLPQLMEQPVENPADREETLGKAWSDAERRTAIASANDMFENLDSAINRCYLPDVAVSRMRAIFGNRIPNRPDLVGVQSAAKAEVRSHAKASTPAPLVGRSISG